MSRLVELAALFLRLGLTAFGGPAAHIAMLRTEVVERRAWLSEGEFLDLLGATQLLPGPNSTEMAIHIGLLRAGWRGLIVAGVCFILPAALLVSLLAWAYVRYGALPQAQGLLYAVKPVIVVVIWQAIWGLARPAVKTRALAGLGGLAGLAAWAGMDELLIMVLAGAGAGLARLRGTKEWLRGLAVACLALSLPLVVTVWQGAYPAGAQAFSNSALFAFFLKVGSVLYGSGYVLLAFLRGTLVERWGWLTSAQLLDATAVGQITPGPVFTTATFIGYLLSGPKGALLATVAIFLPAFFFVALSGWLLPKLQGSATTRAVLDGVNVAALALMLAVSWQLARVALTDAPTVLWAALCAWLLWRRRVNSAALILAGALWGLCLQ